jgi:hypothetical protein
MMLQRGLMREKLSGSNDCILHARDRHRFLKRGPIDRSRCKLSDVRIPEQNHNVVTCVCYRLNRMERHTMELLDLENTRKYYCPSQYSIHICTQHCYKIVQQFVLHTGAITTECYLMREFSNTKEE